MLEVQQIQRNYENLAGPLERDNYLDNNQHLEGSPKFDVSIRQGNSKNHAAQGVRESHADQFYVDVQQCSIQNQRHQLAQQHANRDNDLQQSNQLRRYQSSQTIPDEEISHREIELHVGEDGAFMMHCSQVQQLFSKMKVLDNHHGLNLGEANEHQIDRPAIQDHSDPVTSNMNNQQFRFEAQHLYSQDSNLPFETEKNLSQKDYMSRVIKMDEDIQENDGEEVNQREIVQRMNEQLDLRIINQQDGNGEIQLHIDRPNFTRSNYRDNNCLDAGQRINDAVPNILISQINPRGQFPSINQHNNFNIQNRLSPAAFYDPLENSLGEIGGLQIRRQEGNDQYQNIFHSKDGKQLEGKPQSDVDESVDCPVTISGPNRSAANSQQNINYSRILHNSKYYLGQEGGERNFHNMTINHSNCEHQLMSGVGLQKKLLENDHLNTEVLNNKKQIKKAHQNVNEVINLDQDDCEENLNIIFSNGKDLQEELDEDLRYEQLGCPDLALETSQKNNVTDVMKKSKKVRNCDSKDGRGQRHANENMRRPSTAEVKCGQKLNNRQDNIPGGSGDSSNQPLIVKRFGQSVRQIEHENSNNMKKRKNKLDAKHNKHNSEKDSKSGRITVSNLNSVNRESRYLQKTQNSASDNIGLYHNNKTSSRRQLTDRQEGDDEYDDEEESESENDEDLTYDINGESQDKSLIRQDKSLRINSSQRNQDGANFGSTNEDFRNFVSENQKVNNLNSNRSSHQGDHNSDSIVLKPSIFRKRDAGERQNKQIKFDIPKDPSSPKKNPQNSSNQEIQAFQYLQEQKQESKSSQQFSSFQALNPTAIGVPGGGAGGLILALMAHKQRLQQEEGIKQPDNNMTVQNGESNIKNADPNQSHPENAAQLSKIVQLLGSMAITMRSHDPKSLNCFDQNSKFRLFCSIIASSKYFDNFILICVLINCLALAFYDYNILIHHHSSTEEYFHLRTIDIVNMVFTFIYFIESCMRSIYLGLIMHKKSYLRNGWTMIDLVILISGFTEFFVDPRRSMSLRIIRVLFRPMKTFNSIPSMRLQIRSLIRSVPDFANVGVFLVFVFILFATMGVQQYSGQLYNTCRLSPYPDQVTQEWLYDISFQRVCSINEHGNFLCPDGLTCGNIDDYEELHIKNENYIERAYINYGITNFDNMGSSLLTVFQMITSETWYYQIVNLMDVDFPIIGVLYCFTVIVIGQFFLLNLILAMIIQAFIKSQKKGIEDEIKQLEQNENSFSDNDSYDQESDEDEDNDSLTEEDEEEGESSQSKSRTHLGSGGLAMPGKSSGQHGAALREDFDEIIENEDEDDYDDEDENDEEEKKSDDNINDEEQKNENDQDSEIHESEIDDASSVGGISINSSQRKLIQKQKTLGKSPLSKDLLFLGQNTLKNVQKKRKSVQQQKIVSAIIQSGESLEQQNNEQMMSENKVLKVQVKRGTFARNLGEGLSIQIEIPNSNQGFNEDAQIGSQIAIIGNLNSSSGNIKSGFDLNIDDDEAAPLSKQKSVQPRKQKFEVDNENSRSDQQSLGFKNNQVGKSAVAKVSSNYLQVGQKNNQLYIKEELDTSQKQNLGGQLSQAIKRSLSAFNPTTKTKQRKTKEPKNSVTLKSTKGSRKNSSLSNLKDIMGHQTKAEREERKKKEQAEKEKEKQRRIQNSLFTSAKMQEEEMKYKNNEDFTAFLRKQATTRRIANIFTEMREKIIEQRSTLQNSQQFLPSIKEESKVNTLQTSKPIDSQKLGVTDSAPEEKSHNQIFEDMDVNSSKVEQHENQLPSGLSRQNSNNLALPSFGGGGPSGRQEAQKSLSIYPTQIMNAGTRIGGLQMRSCGVLNPTGSQGLISLVGQGLISGLKQQKTAAISEKKSLIKQTTIFKNSIRRGLTKNRSVFQKFGTQKIDHTMQQTSILEKLTVKVMTNLEKAEIGQQIVTKNPAPEVQDKGELSGLLSKKFILEMRKNMVMNLLLKASQKNDIMVRRQKYQCIDKIYKFQRHPLFSGFMYLVVAANLLVLAIDHFPASQEFYLKQEILNLVFTLCYILEVILKLVAYGPKNYIKSSPYHIFDGIISIISLADMLTIQVLLQDEIVSNSIAITVVRATRGLRIFKLARYWRGFKILLQTLWETIVRTSAFTCLMIVVMYSYILLGQELFAHRVNINKTTGMVDAINGTSPMFNFDNFINSFMSMFLILVNDTQSTIYYNYYRAGYSVSSTIFWLTAVIIVQKILNNLFIAIILEKFKELTLKNEIFSIEDDCFDYDSKLWANIKDVFRPHLKRGYEQFQLKVTDPIIKRVHQFIQWIQKFLIKQQQKSDESGSDPANTDDKEGGSHQEKNIHEKQQSNELIHGHHGHAIEGISIFVFRADSKLRHNLYAFTHHKYYNQFMVLCILFSAVILALDTPLLNPKSQTKTILYWIDYITLAIFSLEACAKIIAHGFLFSGENSYLNSGWNILDFTILIFSYLCLTPLVSTLKVVKAFKSQKLLRLISRNEGLQVALRALLFAIPNVLRITFIMSLFYLVFSIITISYFKGRLYYCRDTYEGLTPQVDTMWDCFNTGGSWQNRIYNWDNIQNSMVTLFVMATTAGWGEMVVDTVTSRDQFLVPHADNQNRDPWWILFFIGYMIVGSIFFLNLFVGVVQTTFRSEQQRAGGEKLLTEKQKEWIDLKLLVLRSAPIKLVKAPKNKFRLLCYKIQAHRNFEKFIQLSIILNTVILMLKWYCQPNLIESITEILNYVFTMIFITEAAIRIIALGRDYFKDSWNIFDFVIACGSAIGILISLNTEIKIKGTSLLRSFRILRLLRLLKRGGQSLNNIFNTFVITMQSLANIGGLFLLFMYIYSVIGMIYFGETKRNMNMNEYINFESFTNAFITLFTVATADTWNYTMAAFTITLEPWNQCIDNPSYDDYVNNNYETNGCGSVAGAFVFFVSFQFLVNFVFLKLLISIIIEGYKNTQVQDERLFNNEQREKFREAWGEFDPEATTFIKLKDLRHFLFKLGAPLGFDESFQESKFLQDKFIASLELPTYHNFSSYQFLDVLDALSFRVMVLDHINRIEDQQRKIEEERIKESNESPQNNEGGIKTIDGKVIQGDIQREVNKLIYQQQSENILAFRELWEKEQKKMRNREQNKDLFGLTSSHHMALEAAIRRIKVILQQKREARAQMQLQQRDTESISQQQLQPQPSASIGLSRVQSTGSLPGQMIAPSQKIQIPPVSRRGLPRKSVGIGVGSGLDRVSNFLIAEQERRGFASLTPEDIISNARKRLKISKHRSTHNVQDQSGL